MIVNTPRENDPLNERQARSRPDSHEHESRPVPGDQEQTDE